MHIERINPDVEFWKLAHKAKSYSRCGFSQTSSENGACDQHQFHNDEELVNDVDDNEEESPWCCWTDIEGSKLIGCDNPE